MSGSRNGMKGCLERRFDSQDFRRGDLGDRDAPGLAKPGKGRPGEGTSKTLGGICTLRRLALSPGSAD